MLLLAPSVYFVVSYAIVYSFSIVFIVSRHYKEQPVILGFGVQMIITFVTFWYLLQKRELKRFYQQQDSEKKEIKATTKEIETTNVLNLQ